MNKDKELSEMTPREKVKAGIESKDKEAQAQEIKSWVDNHFAANVYSKRDKGMVVNAIKDFIYQQGCHKLPEGKPPLPINENFWLMSDKEREAWRKGVQAERDICVEFYIGGK